MLNKIKIDLIKHLIENKKASIVEISDYLNIKTRMCYVYVNEINYLLEKNNKKTIGVDKSYLYLDLSLNELDELIKNNLYLFSQDERVEFICFDIIVFDHKYLIDDYAEIFEVSKSTIASDFKKAKNKLKEFDLKIKFSFDKKYQIVGEQINIRRFIIYYISWFIMKNSESVISRLFNMVEIKNQTIIDELLVINKVKKYSESYFSFLMFYISVLVKLYEKKNFIKIDDSNKKLLNSIQEFKLSNNIFNLIFNNPDDKNYDERYYLTILLSSGNIFSEEKSFLRSNDLMLVISTMISNIESSNYIFFCDKDVLISDLINHLIPTYYRIKFSLNIKINYADVIKQKYSFFFEIVKKNIYLIEEFLKVKFSDDEIALVTLYFASNLLTNKNKNNKVKTIVVSNEGLNFHRILKVELENIFLNIDIVKIINLNELKNISKDYDLILSTVTLNTDKEYVKIHSILSEKNKLEIDQKIKSILNKRIHKNVSVNKVLKKEFINIFDIEDLDWVESIQLASKTLIDNKRIEQEYVNAIINNINKFNSIIRLSENIAMPHASFNDGVNKLSFSFNVFKKPVVFPDKLESKIKLIIILAPIDNEKHIKPMFDIVDILKDESNVNKILEMSDSKEIYNFLVERKGINE